MKTEIIQLYPQNENVTLTSYIINDSVEMLNGKKRPAILYIGRQMKIFLISFLKHLKPAKTVSFRRPCWILLNLCAF